MNGLLMIGIAILVLEVPIYFMEDGLQINGE